MSRPLRLQFPGALYHVTSRGHRKCAIYLDHTDRMVWLSMLAEVCLQYNFVVHGFCLMDNHYHIVLETLDGNLSQGMQQLNSLYPQYFNRRHEMVGHLFQGRYHAVLVQREVYMMELTRYVVLNPVRAGMVPRPDDWPWSSYCYLTGAMTPPPWLDVATTLLSFGVNLPDAVLAYRKFVMDGLGAASPLAHTRHQLILGDDQFIASLRKGKPADRQKDVVKQQRRALALTLDEYAKQSASRDEAMAKAYYSTAYTMTEIATYFGLSVKTVSRAIKKHRAR